MADDRKTQQHWICFIKLTNTQSSNCVIKALISSYKSKKKDKQRTDLEKSISTASINFYHKVYDKASF